MTSTQPLLGVKDLARVLGRSERYIWYMRSRGFRMSGGRSTLDAAIAWLEANPEPCKAATRRK
jgi:hypothetical protein